MLTTRNEFHRHHARAAERCWQTRRFTASFGHGLAAFSAAPWRSTRRFFTGAAGECLWKFALRLITKPAP